MLTQWWNSVHAHTHTHTHTRKPNDVTHLTTNKWWGSCRHFTVHYYVLLLCFQNNHLSLPVCISHLNSTTRTWRDTKRQPTKTSAILIPNVVCRQIIHFHSACILRHFYSIFNPASKLYYYWFYFKCYSVEQSQIWLLLADCFHLLLVDTKMILFKC